MDNSLSAILGTGMFAITVATAFVQVVLVVILGRMPRMEASNAVNV